MQIGSQRTAPVERKTTHTTSTMNPESKSLSVMFAQLHQERLEAKIRLYGILWLLVEQEVISEGKARELTKRPLREMIDECLKYRETTEVDE